MFLSRFITVEFSDRCFFRTPINIILIADIPLFGVDDYSVEAMKFLLSQQNDYVYQ